MLEEFIRGLSSCLERVLEDINIPVESLEVDLDTTETRVPNIDIYLEALRTLGESAEEAFKGVAEKLGANPQRSVLESLEDLQSYYSRLVSKLGENPMEKMLRRYTGEEKLRRGILATLILASYFLESDEPDVDNIIQAVSEGCV